jgi:CRP/FNR family transcriptional regulator, cyclic AMP receptor protein
MPSWASVVSGWVAPAILFVLVLAMGFAGIRWMGSQQVASVRSVPLFSGLSTRQLRSILRSAREVEFPPGGKIVTEGDPGKSFYLIRRGRAVVGVGGVETAVIEPDAYFGEVSLLDGGPRTATVTAETQVSAYEITSSSFDRLLESDPSIAKAVMDRISRWLPETEEKVDQAGGGTVGRPALAEMGGRLRAARHQEWGEPPKRGRRARPSP